MKLGMWIWGGRDGGLDPCLYSTQPHPGQGVWPWHGLERADPLDLRQLLQESTGNVGSGANKLGAAPAAQGSVQINACFMD